ncbi:MAG TPA: hypothetical protein VHV51_05200 [Polyangiaceae bacterium]|jgi:hypothetical protein|nr:hypothetical protein [Polyangiaceae bacterium]
MRAQKSRISSSSSGTRPRVVRARSKCASKSGPLAAGDLEGSNATHADGTSTNASSQAEPPNKKTEPSTKATEPQPNTTPPESVRAPDTEVKASRNWHGLLELPLAVASVGPLPKPSLGGAFAAGLALDRWRFLAEGALWQKQIAQTTFQSVRYDAGIAHFSGRLRGCRALTRSRFEFAPCLTLTLKHISATGSGPHIVPSTRTSTWLAPGVTAKLGFHVAPWLSLIATADAALETARPEISLAGVGRVGQVAAAAATITIWARVDFVTERAQRRHCMIGWQWQGTISTRLRSRS